MKAGVYWYKGPFQTSWNEKAPWEDCDWMVVRISAATGSCYVIGTDAGWSADTVARMEREGSFVEILKPDSAGEATR